MNEDRKLTKAGANLIKHFEGCLRPHDGKFKSYQCPAGVWTIGWGTTTEHGNKVKSGTVWSKEQCDAAFLRDMEVFEKDVRRLVRVPLEPWQFDALVSFTYNCGAGNLQKSTLLKYVNTGQHNLVPSEFLKWNKGGGKVLPGLVRRRKCEALLYQNIPDENYDGVADKPHKEDHPMPQAVDSPEDET